MTTSIRDPRPKFTTSDEQKEAIVKKAIRANIAVMQALAEAVAMWHISRWARAWRQKQYHGTRQIRMRKNQPKRNLKC